MCQLNPINTRSNLEVKRNLPRGSEVADIQWPTPFHWCAGGCGQVRVDEPGQVCIPCQAVKVRLKAAQMEREDAFRFLRQAALITGIVIIGVILALVMMHTK